MAHLHCQTRTRIRTRTPNPMATLYYAELFTLVRIRTRIPVRTDSPISVPINQFTQYSAAFVYIFFCFFIKSSSAKMAHCRVLTRKARKQNSTKKIAYICTIQIVANVPSREKYLGASIGKNGKRGILYPVSRPAKIS